MNDALVNLTPHPMHIYPVGTNPCVDPATVTPIQVIPPSTTHPVVRLGSQTLAVDTTVDIGIPVHRVAFGGNTDTTIPSATAGVWYIVSTLVALAHPDRDDLLVPHGTIRDLSGNTIGSTGFARPTPSSSRHEGEA